MTTMINRIGVQADSVGINLWRQAPVFQPGPNICPVQEDKTILGLNRNTGASIHIRRFVSEESSLYSDPIDLFS